jgi:hypothetical protein
LYAALYKGRGVVHTGFWWLNLRERDHSKNPGVDGRIILKVDLRVVGWGNELELSG